MHLGHVHDGVQLPGRVPGGLQAVLVPRGADTHRPGLQVEAVWAGGGAGVGQHQGHVLLWLGLTTLVLPCWGRGQAGTLNAVTAFITDSVVVVVMTGVLVLTLRRGGEGEGEVGGVSAREDLLMRLVGGFTRVFGRILGGVSVTATAVTFGVSKTVSEAAENPGQTFAAGAAVAISGCVLLRS